jgi:hypothetical protein
VSKLALAGLVSAVLIGPILAGCQSTASTATGRPTPAPTLASTARPSAGPTTAPSTGSVAPSAAGARRLLPSDLGATFVAGSYQAGAPFAEPLSFEVPDGFALERLREGSVAVSLPQGWLGAFIPVAVFPDPCKVTGDPVTPAGSDELLADLRSMRGFTAGKVTETTIGGRRARSFDLTNTIDTSTVGCTRGLMLPLFTSLGNPDGESTNGGGHQVLWVVDAATPARQPILIVADGFATDADLGLLGRIVESVDFED